MFTRHQAATTSTSRTRCSIWQTLHDGLRVFLPSWLFFKWVVLGQNKLKSVPVLHFTTFLSVCFTQICHLPSLYASLPDVIFIIGQVPGSKYCVVPGAIFLTNYRFYKNSIVDYKRYRARFTKQGKLTLERNSIKAPMGGGNSAGDLLIMRTLKNTDATRSFP